MSTDLESAGAAATVAVAAPEFRLNPWWIPPFLGRVPNIEKRLDDLLGFVALALLFENYDFSLLNAALKHIARDLGIGETAPARGRGANDRGRVPSVRVSV